MKRALLLALLLAPGLGAATTLKPMTVEELARASADVIKGRAVESWSEFSADRSMIHTYTRFEVQQRMKGAAPASIVVKQPGGSAGGYTQKVHGVRHFAVGEEAVLFLRPSEANDGTRIVTGLLQGNFRLSRSPRGELMVSNGVSGAKAVQRGAVVDYEGSRMTLRELETRVRRAAK